MCKDHNIKFNVLPQLVAPSMLFNLSETKANSQVNLDVIEFGSVESPQKMRLSTLVHISSNPDIGFQPAEPTSTPNEDPDQTGKKDVCMLEKS
jgi:hypothetical protein